jgi:hypothetical protein
MALAGWQSLRALEDEAQARHEAVAEKMRVLDDLNSRLRKVGRQ